MLVSLSMSYILQESQQNFNSSLNVSGDDVGFRKLNRSVKNRF